MGLPVSVLARGSGARSSAANTAVCVVFDELNAVDRVFSPYKPDSVVSQIARGEIRIEDCDDLVREVALRCEAARELTGGLFDAVGPDGTWDPSGLVKGWATERCFRHLAAVPDLDWCLNAGGDVVVSAPSGHPFNVGIQDPRRADRVAAVLPCVRGAVATSGTTARGAHLYDPRTGDVTTSPWLSVSITGQSLETADVLATAAFVAGESWWEVVDLQSGYEALGIDNDYHVVTTPGWPVTPQSRLEP